ncbi:MFS transporter [Cellulomonas sp. McL0617]|uniref:MFS transporter n=1 Tax=Cellulomonas sp. McL0617 TaxID=3415675 RepID=UPI003CF805D2
MTATAERTQAVGFDRRLTAPLVIGSVLNPINSSMIAVSLIPIGIAFGAPPAQTIWLVSALYLATAVGQPVVGRLVDLFGPRRLYLLGTGLVGVAGVLGALAPSLGLLVAARVLLGFGTCAAYPAAMYLLRSESRRTGVDSPAFVLTALAIANQTVAVIGPTLGGVLIGIGGWRTIFTVNIPLAIACLILGSRRLPRVVPVSETRGIDLPGMVLFATMLTTLMLFLMKPAADEWYLPVVAVAAAVGLVVRELRQRAPFLDLRVLGGNVPLLATYGRQILQSTVTYSFMYGYVQWLESTGGLSATSAGLLLLPMSTAAIAASAVSGRRPQVRGKLVVGGALLVLGTAGLLTVDAGTAVWALIGIAVLIGISQGLNGLANQNALYRQAEPARMGSSAGLLRTFTYLGAITASAVLAASFAHGASTAGLHQLTVVMLGCAVALLVLTTLDRSLHRTTVTLETA